MPAGLGHLGPQREGRILEAGAREAGLEVLIVVHEVGSVLPVDQLTGLLYILGHARRATAKHPNLAHLSGNWIEKERPGALRCSLFGEEASPSQPE